METVHKFDYKGFKCAVIQDEYGFWGCGESSKEDYFEFMFPDSSLEESIAEVKLYIDELLNSKPKRCGGRLQPV